MSRAVALRSSLILALAACAAPRTTVSGGSVVVPAVAAAPATLALASPSSVGMSSALPARLDSILVAAIADRATPGAAVAIGRNGRLVVDRGWGWIDWRGDATAVSDSTLYDMASLTKVIATTTAAMLLEEEGKLDIERPVASYLSEFNVPDKATMTVRSLLQHSSGMQPDLLLWRQYSTLPEYIRHIAGAPLKYAANTRSEYSDWNMIVMQAIIERVSGRRLDSLLADRVWTPLGMRDTRFTPDSSLKWRIAPTETQDFRGGQVWGVVHDENSWKAGGVVGHAGLFSSARDLAIYAQMMLNGGEYNGVRILRPETIARWTARQQPFGSRALGWDTPSPRSSAGRYYSARSFGHTGFTGTSIWVDPEKQLFVVLLTNRVNPTRNNQKIGPLRRVVANAAQEAVLDAPVRVWEADTTVAATPR